MHHKGTGCECVNWIYVTRDNVKQNELRSCCTENRGFLKSQDSALKDILFCTRLFAGHVARMGEDIGLHRMLVGKPEGKRPLERRRRRWDDNIKMDLQEFGVGGGRGD
jgi:hypothetical protein